MAAKKRKRVGHAKRVARMKRLNLSLRMKLRGQRYQRRVDKILQTNSSLSTKISQIQALERQIFGKEFV